MKIDLKYGRDVISFEPPKAWKVSLVDHGHPLPRPFEETLVASCAEPYGSPPLEDWVAGKDVLIIVSDVTRYTGADLLLPQLQRKFLLGRAAFAFSSPLATTAHIRRQSKGRLFRMRSTRAYRASTMTVSMKTSCLRWASPQPA